MRGSGKSPGGGRPGSVRRSPCSHWGTDRTISPASSASRSTGSSPGSASSPNRSRTTRPRCRPPPGPALGRNPRCSAVRYAESFVHSQPRIRYLDDGTHRPDPPGLRNPRYRGIHRARGRAGLGSVSRTGSTRPCRDGRRCRPAISPNRLGRRAVANRDHERETGGSRKGATECGGRS